MVILTLVLGSLVAMGLPILVAVFALSAALSVIGLLGHLFGIPSIAPTVATMIGLGVGIDYALFMVTRHKDQIARGMGIRESVAEAVATSGSAIVFAGSTVIIALTALVLADIPLVTSIGLAAAVAVLIAVLGATTLLPAGLSLVGNGIHRLAVPAFLQRREASAAGGFWAAWARAVTGHPWLALLGSVALLVPLIIPVFSLELGQEDISVAPTSTTERRAYDLTTAGLGVGYNGPLLVASTLDPVAKPSKKYENQYDEATSLQKELEKEKKSLTQQQKELEAQQAELEQQQAELEVEAADLQTQQDELLAEQAALESEKTQLQAAQLELEQQQAALQAEAQDLRRAAEELAAEARRTAEALVAVRAREDADPSNVSRTPPTPRRSHALSVASSMSRSREQATDRSSGDARTRRATTRA